MFFTVAPIRHPNCVELIGGCWEDGPDKLCIVLEFCPLGSVVDLLKDEDNSWSSPYHSIATDITQGFVYLHHGQPGNPLIHRDLKPANVLIAKGIVAKVADFGESIRFNMKEASKLAKDGKHAGKADVLTMVSLDPPHASCLCVLRV